MALTFFKPELSKFPGRLKFCLFAIITTRKWQLENAELEMVDGDDMETRESAAVKEAERLEEEKYLMERAKETAETSHVTTSEQEETSSFVITGN